MPKAAPQHKAGRRRTETAPIVATTPTRAPMTTVIAAARRWNDHDPAGQPAEDLNAQTVEDPDGQAVEGLDVQTPNRPGGRAAKGLIKRGGYWSKAGRKGARVLRRRTVYLAPPVDRAIDTYARRHDLSFGDALGRMLVEAGLVKVRLAVPGESTAPASRNEADDTDEAAP